MTCMDRLRTWWYVNTFNESLTPSADTPTTHLQHPLTMDLFLVDFSFPLPDKHLYLPKNGGEKNKTFDMKANWATWRQMSWTGRPPPTVGQLTGCLRVWLTIHSAACFWRKWLFTPFGVYQQLLNFYWREALGYTSLWRGCCGMSENICTHSLWPHTETRAVRWSNGRERTKITPFIQAITSRSRMGTHPRRNKTLDGSVPRLLN